MHGTPLRETPELAALHQPLAPVVVGLLVKDPGTFQHLAGVHLAVVEAVEQRGAVVIELHHLAHEVGTFVHTNAAAAIGLGHGRMERTEGKEEE